MLTNALIGAVDQLLSWIISVRPAWNFTLPGSVQSAISDMLALDNILPVGEFFQVLAVVGSLFTVLLTLKWGVKLVDYIADVLP